MGLEKKDVLKELTLVIKGVGKGEAGKALEQVNNPYGRSI